LGREKTVKSNFREGAFVLRFLRLSLVIGLALALPACRSSVEPVSATLGIASNGTVVTLTNTSDASIYYYLVDPEFLAVADLALCTSPTCPHVPPHSSMDVPYTAIVGRHSAGTQVSVIEWRLAITLSGRLEQIGWHSRTFSLQ